jgi:ArsR family transcriptional regulator
MGKNGLGEDLDDRAIVRALKALADPSRFRMVQEIAAAGELNCGQVAERFDFSQPTISHHLKILVDAGILCARSEGKHHFVQVDRTLLGELAVVLPARLLPEQKRRALPR